MAFCGMYLAFRRGPVNELIFGQHSVQLKHMTSGGQLGLREHRWAVIEISNEGLEAVDWNHQK